LPTDAVQDGWENPVNIPTVTLLMSMLVFWVAAWLYVLPRLPECEPKSVLLPILLLHAGPPDPVPELAAEVTQLCATQSQRAGLRNPTSKSHSSNLEDLDLLNRRRASASDCFQGRV
jgi:hypothetical protein